jgi:ribonuclease HI
MACAVENVDSGYRNRNICILLHSQAAIKARDNYRIYSKLVWDYHQSLAKLAERNIVQLIGVTGHRGIEGNETADQLARLGSECPSIEPEPACCISAGNAKKVVRDWTETTKYTGSP